jgi:putative PIN family toxin of toxin-antitoxin system
LIGHWEAGNCVPLLSRTTAAELTRVLAYPKFCLSADEQLEILGGYLPFCEVVEIAKPCPVFCRDAKDQPFLDLAESGNAGLLMTDDRDLLALVGQTEFLRACLRFLYLLFGGHQGIYLQMLVMNGNPGE